MEELFVRFPHLSEKIYSKLNYQSLVTCREVSKTWNNSIEVEKSSYLKIIKDYTKCSDELLEEVLNNFKAPIILVSILDKIFSNFPKGTTQSQQYFKWDNTPLHIAAESGHLAAYNLIMENVGDKNPIGMNLVPLKILGVKKPNQLRSDVHTEYTPLHLAAINGHLSTCKLIIENVVEKNPSNKYLFTPLHAAAANGNYSIFQMIIASIQGNRNPRDILGITPLQIASAYGHFDICVLLLSYEEIANSLADFHETPYHLAAANGHIKIYKLLMDRKIHGQRVRDGSGRFPLHHAANYGHLDICKLILENAEYKDSLGPSNCNFKDILEKSPLDMAIKNDHHEIQRYFMGETQLNFTNVEQKEQAGSRQRKQRTPLRIMRRPLNE